MEASPEVQALLREDPDLQAGLSEAEIRSTLEAARTGGTAAANPASTEDAAPTATSGTAAKEPGSEWSRLEKEQREKSEARQNRLETTLVFAAPDGLYHARGCPALYNHIQLQDGTLQRVYVGRQLNLAQALRTGLQRHGECGAPDPASLR